MDFTEDCISEGWQSQGSQKKWREGKIERQCNKGQERDNGVPGYKEQTHFLGSLQHSRPYSRILTSEFWYISHSIDFSSNLYKPFLYGKSKNKFAVYFEK